LVHLGHLQARACWCNRWNNR